MLSFEWNALRVGDRVVFHDPAGIEFPLLAGTVAMLETKRGRGANGVGVRVVAAGAGYRVVWPSHRAAHRDPPDPTEDCWRCSALAAAAPAAPIAASTSSPDVADESRRSRP